MGVVALHPNAISFAGAGHMTCTFFIVLTNGFNSRIIHGPPLATPRKACQERDKAWSKSFACTKALGGSGHNLAPSKATIWFVKLVS